VAFAVAAVVMTGLMFTAAVSVARMAESTIERVQASAPTIKRLGGVALILVGVWLLALATFADTFARLFPV